MDWKAKMRPDERAEYDRANDDKRAATKIRKRIYNRVRQRLAREAERGMDS